MALTLSVQETWWAFNEAAAPCTCCSFESMEDGYWNCRNGRRWMLVDEPIKPNKPHDYRICPGNCKFHPLVQEHIMTLLRSEFLGQMWGDIIYDEEAAAAAALSEEERQARALREANARAAEAALAALEEEARRMAAYAHDKGIQSRCKNAVTKIQAPCIWLYCDEKAPKIKNAKGESCAPKRNFLTGSQCWAWEYLDPKTKQYKKPHACDRLHPGEVGWLNEWNTNRDFRPNASRWDGLVRPGYHRAHTASTYVRPPVAAPAAYVPARPPPTSNGFSSLSGWDSD